jgi:hypothetical protein
MDAGSAVLPASRAAVLLRRGRALEVITLGWNVAESWCWPSRL